MNRSAILFINSHCLYKSNLPTVRRRGQKWQCQLNINFTQYLKLIADLQSATTKGNT